MFSRTVLLIAFGGMLSLATRAPAVAATAAEPATAAPAPAAAATTPAAAGEPAAQSSAKHEVESAPIEEVVEAIDNGYRSNAYIVRWHGARVLVNDLLAEGHLEVGDTLHFMVMRNDVVGQKILNFMSTEHSARPHKKAAQSQLNVTTETSTASVEEVLSVQDDGYRSIAYLAKWHGLRVAVTDPLASTSQHVGDSINIVATHSALADRQLLMFNLLPDEKSLPATANTRSPDKATVEEVLNSQIDGASYLTYLVRWHGSAVALMSLEGSAPLHQVGDSIPIRVSRMSRTGKDGILAFGIDNATEQATTGAPASADSAQESMSVSANSTQDSATVERVLSAKDDGYLYRSYVVTWHGAQVVIPTITSTPQHEVGDCISFTVTHFTQQGQSRLIFFLFDLPTAKPSASDSKS